MEDMDFFDQDPAIPFGGEFALSLSPLGDEFNTEQYDDQEQEASRVSSPSLYSNFSGFPGFTKKDASVVPQDECSKETLTAQIVGLINQPFVTVSISESPGQFAECPLPLSPPPQTGTPPEKGYFLTTLSASPIDTAGSDLLELVEGFNSEEGLGCGPLADPNLLFDLGPIPTSVVLSVDQTSEGDAAEASFDNLPALLDSFQPDDVDNMGQDEIDSILASHPSSPTEPNETSAVAQDGDTSDGDTSDGGRPALAGFFEVEEAPVSRKAKPMRVARSTRARRPKPYDDFVLEEETEGRPLGRPSDPTLLVPDRKARKKDQNRDAALRYRQKKKKEMDTIHEDASRLEETNRELKDKVEELTHDIDLLKNILREKYLKEGKQLPAVLKSK